MSERKLLRRRALRLMQEEAHPLYTFALTGEEILSIADVSRLSRNTASKLIGYQRPEVKRHVNDIVSYLNGDSVLFPNSIILALSSAVRFVRSRGPEVDDGLAAAGTLEIPLPGPGEAKPAWIVDGQQRVAAIREARVQGFPVFVVAFVARNAQEQREQFILVNSTKPLPKGLVYELLPATESRLPDLLERRRFPTRLLERLNLEADSPLAGRIRTQTMPEGAVKDNSVLKMLENSLSEGVLYRFRDESAESGDEGAMLRVLKDYWRAVSEVWRPIWPLPPRKSRLLHGAGVISLGFVMDAICDRRRAGGVPNQAQFEADLAPLRDVCRWTEGHWEFGPGVVRKWNEVQNTPKDIQALANYLLVQYKRLVWSREPG